MKLRKSGKMANPLIPPGYRFDERSGRYRNAQGRFVATKSLLAMMGALEKGSGDTLKKLAVVLYRDQIPAPAWYLASAQQLQRLHVQFAALGAGGVDALTPKDFRSIDRAVRAEINRLLTFGTAIVGKTLSEAQINARVDMYLGSARKAYWRHLAKPRVAETEVVVERRLLGTADHCEWCLYLSEAGWQPVNTLPIPGESNDMWSEGQCLSACRCQIERRVIEKAEAASLLGTPLPSQYQRRE